ncbi:hypothetical protein LguiB_032774 [Lonicera macranthoides]
MALLGEDGRGFELARKLESVGAWRPWLGDAIYANFLHYLSSPSSWETFMRTDDSKTRAQIQIQLRARALLFDKASISLFLPSNHQSSSSSSSAAISKLNPNYLQLHGDDVYFTLENSSQDGVQHTANAASSKVIVVVSNVSCISSFCLMNTDKIFVDSDENEIHSKSAFGIGSRYGEPDIDNMPQRFRHDELPETWYSQFFEKYRASKPYRLSFGDRDTDRRTPEQMFTYLRVLEKHKRRRVAFKEDQNTGFSKPMFETGSSMRSNSGLDETNAIDVETLFFPETMFTMNCVPDSALPPTNREENNPKVEFNGVLDNLPQIMTRSPIMIERLGIRPEYLSMEQGGNQIRGKNGSEGSRKNLGQEQASEMSKKVVARLLTSAGFEAASEVPMEVLSQLLSCHVCKLGRILKVLADSYRKQCSAMELIKMFLQTAGYSNLGALAELVKDNTRSVSQPTRQQVQGIQSQMQSEHQTPIQQPQQISRQMQIQMQMQQMINNTPNMTIQQQQQQQHWERLRRRQQQPSTPRPVMNMNIDKERPMVQVKIENQSDFPMDTNNAFSAMHSRHPQMQFRQQQLSGSMPSLHSQPGNQFRPLTSLQIPQNQTPNMGMIRAPPVKVEGFQELMGGDSSLKHDSEENKLTSPK